MGGISAETREKVARVWDELLVVVAEGEHIGEACARHGLTRHDVRHYRMQDAAAEKAWQIAREQSADTYADQVGEIASNPGLDAARERVRLDALRWLAAKRNPRIYSDKSTVDVNVRTVDLTRIIERANARLAEARNPALAARAAGAVDAVIAHAALPQSLDDLA